jgi:hypothetical protein
LWFAIVLTVGVDESATVQAEHLQVSRDGAPADGHPLLAQFEGDPGCRPLLFAAHRLDHGHDVGRGRSGLTMWS